MTARGTSNKLFASVAPVFLYPAVAVFVLAVLGTHGNAFAEPQGLKGNFSMMLMVHTPGWPAAGDSAPWDGRSDGNFVYRAAPCSAANAPVNNNSSDLPSYNTRVPGGRVPAATRALPMRLSIENGRIRGTVHLTVCKLGPGHATDNRSDAERDKIVFEIQMMPERFGAEEVGVHGSFRIAGGTGRYADLTGKGRIAGYFFCYDRKGCGADKAHRYRDALFTLHGSFFDPTGPD